MESREPEASERIFALAGARLDGDSLRVEHGYALRVAYQPRLAHIPAQIAVEPGKVEAPFRLARLAGVL